MKKFLGVAMGTLLLLFLFLSVSISNSKVADELFVQNVTRVSIDYNGKLTEEEILNELVTYGKENKVSFGEVIGSDDGMDIYETNFEKINKIIFKENKNNVQNQLNYNSLKYKLDIHQLDEDVVKNIGLKNIMYFRSDSKSKQNTIEFLNTISPTKEIENVQLMNINVLIFIFIIIMDLIILLCISYFIETISYKSAVMNLLGHDCNAITKRLFIELIDDIFSKSVLVFILITCIIYIIFIGNIIGAIWWFAVNLVLILLYLIIKLRNNVKKQNVSIRIKRKANWNKLLGKVRLIKLVSLVIIILASTVLCNIIPDIYSRNKHLEYWEKANNYYELNVLYNPADHLKKIRNMNDKMVDLYNHLDKKGAILIDTDNFSFDGEKYLYEENSLESPTVIYGAHGKSIVVNENYLVANNIKYSSGKPLRSQIKVEKNTLNVVVPMFYKEQENKIIHQLTEDFYFQKVEATNLDNEELALPLVNTKKEDLNINIIYAENNQNYFTYKFDMFGKDKFSIVDPISIIYNAEAIDSNFAASYMMGNVLFKTKSKEPYKYIKKDLEETETVEYITSVSSVYDIGSIEVKKGMREIISLFVILCMSVMLYLYLVVENLFIEIKKNKEKIRLMSLLGKTNKCIYTEYIRYVVIFYSCVLVCCWILMPTSIKSILLSVLLIAISDLLMYSTKVKGVKDEFN